MTHSNDHHVKMSLLWNFFRSPFWSLFSPNVHLRFLFLNILWIFIFKIYLNRGNFEISLNVYSYTSHFYVIYELNPGLVFTRFNVLAYCFELVYGMRRWFESRWARNFRPVYGMGPTQYCEKFGLLLIFSDNSCLASPQGWETLCADHTSLLCGHMDASTEVG